MQKAKDTKINKIVNLLLYRSGHAMILASTNNLFTWLMFKLCCPFILWWRNNVFTLWWTKNECSVDILSRCTIRIHTHYMILVSTVFVIVLSYMFVGWHGTNILIFQYRRWLMFSRHCLSFFTIVIISASNSTCIAVCLKKVIAALFCFLGFIRQDGIIPTHPNHSLTLFEPKSVLLFM